MVTCCGNDDSQGHLGFSKQKSGAQQAQPEGNMFARKKSRTMRKDWAQNTYGGFLK